MPYNLLKYAKFVEEGEISIFSILKTIYRATYLKMKIFVELNLKSKITPI